MIRYRWSILTFALASLVPGGGTAVAGDSIPYPPECTVPSVVVGNISGLPMGEGFEVVVRRFGSPVSHAIVQLYFPTEGPRPLLEEEAGTSVNCTARTLTREADANGVCVFHPRLAGFAGAPVIDVRANGVLLAQSSARSTDIDGNGAVGLVDFQRFAANFLHAPTTTETDYDGSGSTDARDFDLFRRDFLAHVHGSLCP